MPGRLKLIVAILLTVVLLLVGAVFFLPGDDTPDVENSNWSLQGEWIAFSCAPRGGSRSSLYLVRPDGSELTRLTTDKIVAITPAWSPNGEEIVFEVIPDKPHRLRRGSEELIPLNVSNEGDRYGNFPAWSPDGQWIAFRERKTLVREGKTLVRVRVDGSMQIPVIGDVAREPFTWSPDGQWIAYQSAGGIHKVRIDTGESQILIPENAGEPAWSPDGRMMAFRNLSDGDIYVAREDGSEITRLTDLPAWTYDPDWSPDGQWIVFVSDYEHTDTQLFKIRADGSDLQQITDTDCSAFHPDWIRMPGSS